MRGVILMLITGSMAFGVMGHSLAEVKLWDTGKAYTEKNPMWHVLDDRAKACSMTGITGSERMWDAKQKRGRSIRLNLKLRIRASGSWRPE